MSGAGYKDLMRSDKQSLLEQINRDLPKEVDWKDGARRYLEYHFKQSGRAAIEHYSFTKPFCLLGAGDLAIDEMVGYFDNFINMVRFVRPKPGARVLDVACGGGWVSHYLTKMGCKTFGFDISTDFVELAKRRIANDTTLSLSTEEIESMFAVIDVETSPLPAEHAAQFDLAILESCLHHFFDPISAMQHISNAMKSDGIVVIIEGENRNGVIRREWMNVMLETNTLERPYPRQELVQILNAVGLPFVGFLGQVNGWLSPADPRVDALSEEVRASAEAMNLCICSKTAAPIAKLFPHGQTQNLPAVPAPECAAKDTSTRVSALQRFIQGVLGAAAHTFGDSK